MARAMLKLGLAIPLAFLAACRGSHGAPSSQPPPQASATEPHGIRFIEDDYARALADARSLKLPLFVDAWASWCHTCLSLRSYVLPDPALYSVAARFIWLSVDTEREQNAPLVARLDVRSLPTLYVIDPASERPLLSWAGALTAGELTELLEDAAGAGSETQGAAAVALLRGHRASAEGRRKDAIAAYREALSAAPPGWPRRAQAVDALITRLSDDKQLAACVVLGHSEAQEMRPGTARADVVRTALGCAEELAPGAPERAVLVDLAALGERIASDDSRSLLADDRSDLYDYVVGALRTLGREDEVRRVAQNWAAFLERQAARAPAPSARAVFDAHRLSAYLALGEPQRALPVLEQSERDFPDDYNPPARLAVAYLALNRPDEALAAIRRALERAYGPRKLRLWSLEADAYEAKGDRISARAALRAALDFANTVALTAGYPKVRDTIQARWERLR